MSKIAKVLIPEVRIPEAVWKRLLAYIAVCPTEVGGLGTVEMIGGAFVVTDVFLLAQEVSSVSTSLDPRALAAFVSEWARAGKDPLLLRFWWHSHADMDVFWSGTDLGTIRELAEDNFLISLVGNRRRETKMRLSSSSPFPFAVDDLPFTVVEEINQRLLDAAKEEAQAKVQAHRFDFLTRLRRRGIDEPAIENGFEAASDIDDGPAGSPGLRRGRWNS